MSLLRRLGAHPAFELIKLTYNAKFPFEVHFACAEWIEDRIRQDQVANLDTHSSDEQRAISFMHSLRDRLEYERSQFIGHDRHRTATIEGVIKMFDNQLQLNAVEMHQEILERIQFLSDFLSNPIGSDQNVLTIDDSDSLKIHETLGNVGRRVSTISELYTNYKLELEMLQKLEYNEKIALKNNLLTYAEWQRLAEQYGDSKRIHTTKREQMLDDLTDHIEMVVNAIARAQCYVVYKLLAGWKRGQALAGNGATLPKNAINEIQIWFERLAELIWSTRKVIEAVSHHNHVLESNFKKINNILIWLIESGFVVEEQPAQVLRLNTR